MNLDLFDSRINSRGWKFVDRAKKIRVETSP